MRLAFNRPRSDSAPSNLLAEAEVRFGPDTPFQGMKLVGFSVWRGDRGTYVTFPSRAFGAGSERKYFDFLRTQDRDAAGRSASERVKRWIAEEYETWAGGGERERGAVEERPAVAREEQTARERAKQDDAPKSAHAGPSEDW